MITIPFKNLIVCAFIGLTIISCKEDAAPTPEEAPALNTISFTVNESPSLKNQPIKEVLTNNNRLKLRTDIISNSDTFVLFLNIPNFRKEPRLYIINLQPNDSNLFPDTTQNFAFYGPKRIFERADRTFSNFILSGSMNVNSLKPEDNSVVLRFNFENEIVNSQGAKTYKVSFGAANIPLP